jgi:hypothetical protein
LTVEGLPQIFGNVTAVHTKLLDDYTCFNYYKDKLFGRLVALNEKDTMSGK